MMKKYTFIYFKWILRFLIAGIIVGGIIIYFNNKNKSICDKCNVIVVSLDTLSSLHLPCYGYNKNTAPSLCTYADQNILFLNSYSQSPTTLNSHFSIFTSLYPSTHKMISPLKQTVLDERYLTLAQVLQSNGYKTVYHGPLSDMHMPLDRGIERGFNVVEGETLDTWGNAFKQLISNSRKNESTFLFLHTYFVHNPYLAGHSANHVFTSLPEFPNIPLTPEEYNKITPGLISFTKDYVMQNFAFGGDDVINPNVELVQELNNAKSFQESERIFNQFPKYVQNGAKLTWYFEAVDKNNPNQVEYLKALYDERIYDLDGKLGRLFDLLKDPILSKNTILVITADHGEEFMEHGNLGHGLNIYRTSTAVPLIIHIPGVQPKKIEELAQGIDIYPTILGLIGLKSESQLQGIDLTGLILGSKNVKINSYVSSEYEGTKSYQTPDWRFYITKNDGNSVEFYNLRTDPGEKNNLKKIYPDINSFHDLLIKFSQRSKSVNS